MARSDTAGSQWRYPWFDCASSVMAVTTVRSTALRRDGPVIETLGWYNPLERDAGKQLQLNEERVKYWLSVGAQPSDTVEDILGKRGIGNLKKWDARRTSRREVIDKKRAAAAAGAATEEKKA